MQIRVFDICERVAAIGRFTGSDFVHVCTWGSATLHPRLYAIATLRGLKFPQLVQSFLSLSSRHYRLRKL